MEYGRNEIWRTTTGEAVLLEEVPEKGPVVRAIMLSDPARYPLRLSPDEIFFHNRGGMYVAHLWASGPILKDQLAEPLGWGGMRDILETGGELPEEGTPEWKEIMDLRDGVMDRGSLLWEKAVSDLYERLGG